MFSTFECEIPSRAPSGARSCERGVGDFAALEITHVIPAALIIAAIAVQLPSRRVRGTAA